MRTTPLLDQTILLETCITHNMKFVQFTDQFKLDGILYAKDQVVRFTNVDRAIELIESQFAKEVPQTSYGWVDHEINVGRIAAE